MDKLDILLWVMAGGFGIIFGLLIIMWNSLNQRIDKLDDRIDRVDEKLTDIDRRLCRLEGAFSSKDCCALKEERNLRKTG